ncbi:hypothetical protein [Sphingomonas sp.]|uniref:hypothetical protein n=1 Tax=Sphingomonas sp. TaxID=28214 RepID=UPI001EB74E0E|nr:hypothetical protein [Sphingomonas sp.]MBX3593187.1 hypothetical protein [Sphingomonas sp.]
MQVPLWIGAGTLVLVAAGSGLADWRRANRRDLDRVGWMPWTLIQLMALLFAVVCAALAIRT